MCVKGFSFAVICFLFISGYSAAQVASPSGSLQPGKTKKTIINYQPGHSYLTVKTGDSLRVIDRDMTQMTDVIVEFKQNPLFIQQSKNKLNKISPLFYKSQQTQFSSDLSALYKNAVKSYSVNLAMPQKKDEYHKVFNGASLSIPRAMVAPVASLPYVKKVHISRQVHINLEESVKLIKADSVWFQYKVKGKGIVVGIIDSGIDYLHPFLGGGFGPGFKVIGGYDFANKDNDPMDDHGHGTHVAGIVAADGYGLTGVAPGASLFALKVLNGNGEGYDSDVISAIEMTVDPNDDGDTSDKLDVVNMSLGSDDGDPFDAMTEAVNNAVKLGVVFCIAAGNGGGYNTIASPGTAELAITVGASDKQDKLASFSSRGPVKKTYSMKPDILAPGVYIRSSLPGDRYERLSGTSMAAPHVAGVCALIKEMHPDWVPGMIKSAIMSTADDIRLDCMSQGAGRVNALKAVNTKTFVIPSQLSFGLDTLSLGILKTADTIEVFNKNESAQTYNITVSGLLPGIELKPEMNVITLPPGVSKKLIFTLLADKTVPFLNSEKPAYDGRVEIKGNIDSLSFPWTFVKLPVLSISFEKPYDYYLLYGMGQVHYWWQAADTIDRYNSQFILPGGNYNILAYFNNTSDKEAEHRFVERPDIKLDGPVKVTVSPSEADHNISFRGVDEMGRELSSLPGNYNNINIKFPVTYHDGFFDLSELFEVYLRMKSGEKIKFSLLSDSIKLNAGQFQCDLLNEHKIRVVNFLSQTGLKNDLEFRNTSPDFSRINLCISQLPDGRSAAGIGDVFNNKKSYMIYFDPSNKSLDKKWKGQLFLSSPQSDTYYTAEVYSYENPEQDGYIFEKLDWESGPFCSGKEGGITMGRWNYFVTLKNNDSIRLGDGPVFPLLSAVGYSSPSGIKSYLHVNIFDHNFMNRTRAENNIIYSIYDENEKLVKKDSIIKYKGIELLEGRHKYKFFTNHYTVGGVWGKAEYTSAAGSESDWWTSPHLNSLQVLNQNGISSSVLRQKEKGRVVFTAGNSSNDPSLELDTVKSALYMKYNGSPQWQKQEMQITKDKNYIYYTFLAETGNYTANDSSLIDLKIVLVNKKEQIIQWSLEPAFAVGDYNYKSIIEPGHELAVIPENYVLHNNYPNPFNPSTVISYGIPAASRVEIKIFDILGREVNTLVDKQQEAGEYKITFNAGNLSSGVYLCRIRAGNFVKTQKLLLIR